MESSSSNISATTPEYVAADYAIYILSIDGVISSWNTSAQRISGLNESDVVGTHFSRFYTAEDIAADLPMKSLKIAAELGCFEGEGWHVREDSTKFWAHVVIDRIKNDAGDIIGFAKVTCDLTERRATAQALEKAKEALFHSQKMEAIGKLTGGVAHDFNNLLSVIANGVALLRMSVTNYVSVKALDSMERAISRGATLSQQLLTFSHEQPLKQDPNDLNRLINSFESVLRRALKSSVRFDLKLAIPLPRVIIDAGQFEAALLNLIINAAEATADNGSITVQTGTVELADKEINHLPSGRYVKVSVTDTGEGIPAAFLPRAVEPFFSTKPGGGGTGLGLSQVYVDATIKRRFKN